MVVAKGLIVNSLELGSGERMHPSPPFDNSFFIAFSRLMPLMISNGIIPGNAMQQKKGFPINLDQKF
jgi:hypothetical protein